MANFEIPLSCTTESLLRAIASARLLESGLVSKKTAIQVSRSSFLSCGALSFFCARGLARRESGSRFAVVGDDDTLRYLSRMNLFRHLDAECREAFSRHTEVGRFIPAIFGSNFR